MRTPKEPFVHRRRNGQTYVVHMNTEAGAAAKEAVRSAHQVYRVNGESVYVTQTVPSVGQSVDLLVSDLDNQAEHPAGRNAGVRLARRTLAGLALLVVQLLPLAVVGLVATAYAAWVGTKDPVEVTDVTVPDGLADDDTPGRWTP